MLRYLGIVLSFLILTLTTQVGGVVLITALLVAKYLRPLNWSDRWRRLFVFSSFVLLYITASLALVPPLAQMGGRVPLQCLSTAERPYQARSPVYCLLNRQYVSPRLADLITTLSLDLAEAHPGTLVTYLDAGFPFLEGFTLLPHLSHRDGRKLDLAFFYEDASGYLPGQTPSPLGYWGFEQPRPGGTPACSEE